MSRRPLPDIEDDLPVERGVGPVAGRGQAAKPAALAEPATEGDGAASGPGGGQAPAAPGTAVGPDGSFTVANPGGTQLVPTAAGAAAAPASPPPSGQAGDGAQQGEVYEVPPQPERPRAEDIIQPRERVEREQISAMVPRELQLIRRMRLLWAHEGIEQRDLVALALDRELRARGY